jgi:hypothetical protein
MVESIYDVIKRLSVLLSDAQLDHLMNRIKTLPLNSHTKDSLLLLRTLLDAACSNQARRQVCCSSDAPTLYSQNPSQMRVGDLDGGPTSTWPGLSVLWELVQDNPKVSEVFIHKYTCFCSFKEGVDFF